MSIRGWLKEIYFLKIKKMSRNDMLIRHLRRTGMNIGDGCFICSEKVETAEPYLVTLGKNVLVASDVLFATHDGSASHYIPGASDLFGRINIGDNCFIGMGSIILPGVTIAENCIVGAGSVVTRNFLNANMVLAGNPAREISTVEKLREKNERYALNVWKIPASERKSFILENEEKFKGYRKDFKNLKK